MFTHATLRTIALDNNKVPEDKTLIYAYCSLCIYKFPFPIPSSQQVFNKYAELQS